jgi:hypothetical protein
MAPIPSCARFMRRDKTSDPRRDDRSVTELLGVADCLRYSAVSAQERDQESASPAGNTQNRLSRSGYNTIRTCSRPRRNCIVR